MRRYDSAGAAPPIGTARSASRTKGASQAASEYTATVETPISRQVRWMRRAISPRFAIRSLRIAASHPEHAELAGARDDVRVDRRERHAQRRPAVAGVDDAVVVEPTAGERGE